MKKSILWAIMASTFLLDAEFLIMVHEGGSYRNMTLDESLQYQYLLGDILMKYQWPMCLQSDLSKQEIDEYLASGSPRAEERFIQKKIETTIDPQEINLKVVFIPTSLYELYVQSKPHIVYDGPVVNLDQAAIDALRASGPIESKKIMRQQTAACNQKFFKNYDPILDHLRSGPLLSRLFKKYPALEQRFPRAPQGETIFASVNRQLIDELSEIVPELARSNSVEGRSDILEEQFEKIMKKFEPRTECHATLREIIALEYAARERNETLLYRGSKLIREPSFNHTDKQLVLLGSTIQGKRSLQDFTQKLSNLKYSVSFGQSLLAGCIRDKGACAYDYMHRLIGDSKLVVGYALSLSKKDLFTDGYNDLFYISGLGTLAGMFGKGEFFHARTKVAVLPGDMDVLKVIGIKFSLNNVSFAHNMLFAERTPAHQEELFARCLLERGIVLQKGSGKDLTITEQQLIHDIATSQQFLAQEYKKIRILSLKVLRRLLRAGSRPIPNLSEHDLRTMLQEGPTREQYVALTSGLRNMDLDPVREDIFLIPRDELIARIVAERGLDRLPNLDSSWTFMETFKHRGTGLLSTIIGHHAPSTDASLQTQLDHVRQLQDSNMIAAMQQQRKTIGQIPSLPPLDYPSLAAGNIYPYQSWNYSAGQSMRGSQAERTVMVEPVSLIAKKSLPSMRYVMTR